MQCVQQQQQHTTSTAAPDTADTALKQAVLYTKFKAHDAAVTALAVLKDEPGVSSQADHDVVCHSCTQHVAWINKGVPFVPLSCLSLLKTPRISTWCRTLPLPLHSPHHLLL